MTRVIPWMQRGIPYFVKAFDKSNLWLPMELWLLIDDEIQKLYMAFDRKVELLENVLNLDYDVTEWEDCTERIFNEPNLLDHVCYFPPLDDIQRPTLFMRGSGHLFSPARLFRLIDAYMEGRYRLIDSYMEG